MPFSQGTYHITSKVLGPQRNKLSVRLPSTVGDPLEAYSSESEPWAGGYKWGVDPGPEANEYHIYPVPNHYSEHLAWGKDSNILVQKWQLAYCWEIKEVDAAYCTIQDPNGRYWAVQPNSVGYDRVVLVNRDVGDRARWILQKV